MSQSVNLVGGPADGMVASVEPGCSVILVDGWKGLGGVFPRAAYWRESDDATEAHYRESWWEAPPADKPACSQCEAGAGEPCRRPIGYPCLRWGDEL